MKAAAVVLLLVLTALRYWLAGALEVTPLEAYYWMCANQLDWAFFDGPAGTALLVRIGSMALGSDPIALRLAFPLLAVLATCGIYLCGRRLFSPEAGLWAAVALNALPFFNFSAFHAGPALPALTAGLFAIWAAVRALDGRPLWWLVAGACVAIGVQFAYAVIAITLGVLLACLLIAKYRREFARPGIPLFLALQVVALIPAWIWNQTNGWPLLARGTLETALTPDWSKILPALADAMNSLSVPLAILLATSAVGLAAGARLHLRPRLILALSAPFLVLEFYALMHGASAPFPLLALAALLLIAAAHSVATLPAMARVAAALLLIAGTGTTAAALASSGSDDPWSRSSGGVPWLKVAASLETLFDEAQRSRTEALFVIAQTPDATAALNYHLPRLAYGSARTVFLRESQDLSNQFGLWPRYDDFVETDAAPDEYFMELRARNPYLGRSALYLTEETPDTLPQTISSAFAEVVPLAVITSADGRDLHVYLCEDYQTMPF